MKDLSALRNRYLRDALPIRLGGIAANLTRIESFCDHPGHQEVVEQLLNESKFFIEWATPETDTATQAELVELQLHLAQWQQHWKHIWANSTQRATVAKQAGAWSKRVLEFSGLLPFQAHVAPASRRPHS